VGECVHRFPVLISRAWHVNTTHVKSSEGVMSLCIFGKVSMS
jgi:hypothetical protein